MDHLISNDLKILLKMASEIIWKYTIIDKPNCLLPAGRNIPENSIVICKDVEKIINEEKKIVKLFALFNPYSSFIRHSFLTNYSDRNFYEIILGHKSQKPYFDIDIKFSDGWTLERSEKLIHNLCKVIIDTFPSVTLEDIMVFSSHGEEKISYHVVVDRWCFAEYRSNKYYCLDIIKRVPDSDVIDTCVYKSLQQFRTVSSSKFGSGRRKTISHLSKWKHKNLQNYNLDDPKTFYIVSQASFITATSYCKILGYKEPEKNIRNYSSDDLTAEQMKSINELDCIKDGTYEILTTKGKLISLKRLKSSYCGVCQRIHENEHPFLTVSDDNNVWFHCRRAEGRTLLSSLSSSMSSAIEFSVESKVKMLEDKQQSRETYKNFYKIVNNPEQAKPRFLFDFKNVKKRYI